MADFPEPFDQQYQSHLKHLLLKGLQPKTIDAYARGMRRIGEYFSYRVGDPGRLHEGNDQRRGIDEGFKTRGEHTQCPTKCAARVCWRPLPMCRTHARELAGIRGMS